MPKQRMIVQLSSLIKKPWDYGKMFAITKTFKTTK